MSADENSFGDRYCNQFVMGPAFVDSHMGWQQVKIASEFCLTAHPDLEVVQVIEGGKSLTLIGYILDPAEPTLSNSLIVQRLLDNFSTSDQLLAKTSQLGGRWVIVVRDQGKTYLFHDALGLRQVFYTDPSYVDELWIMSQPGVYPFFKDLVIDDQANAFIDSYEIRTYAEYRWPGVASAFREIKHLSPNHALDLGTAQVWRYWPNEHLEKLSLSDGVSKAAAILKGLMLAANNRFDLVIGMTAGFDSRVVLAASKQFQSELSAITVRQGTMSDDHQDIEISKNIMRQIGLKHETIKAKPYMSADFSKYYKENVFMAHDHYGPDAEAIFEHLNKKKVVVTGSGAEVARESFRTRTNEGQDVFLAQELARLQWMGEDDFATKNFQAWLDGVVDRKNIDILDLFSWEQSHGNWLANTQLEFDIAWREIFTPFNCRELLTTLLSIDSRFRNEPNFVAYEALVELMWPELLRESINPMDSGKKNKHKTWLRRAGSAVKSKLRKLA